MYQYKATIVEVVDGDTVVLMIDLGFNSFQKERVRILGINAPEKKKKTMDAWLAAKQALTKLFYDNFGKPCQLYIETQKNTFFDTDKYGRWLADIIVEREESVNVSKWMVENGFAVIYLPRS